jgi:hypothetical protein
MDVPGHIENRETWALCINHLTPMTYSTISYNSFLGFLHLAWTTPHRHQFLHSQPVGWKKTSTQLVGLFIYWQPQHWLFRPTWQGNCVY